MKKYVAKDLEIIRPMRLIRKKEFVLVPFPYNVLEKMGLVDLKEYTDTESGYLNIHNPIKKLNNYCQLKFPKKIHLVTRKGLKRQYAYLADDTTIALRKKENGFIEYEDIFTGKTYQKNSSVRTFSFSEYLTAVKREDFVFGYGEEPETFAEEINNSELTVEELREIRDQIAEDEANQKITFITLDHPYVIADPSYSKDSVVRKESSSGVLSRNSTCKEKRLLLPSRYQKR